MIPYIIQGNNITVMVDNSPYTITSSHINFERLKQAIKDQDWEAVKKFSDPSKAIIEYSQGNVTIKDSKVFWQGYEMQNALTRRMITMFKESFVIDPLAHFMDNLHQNPSKTSINELYGFMEKCDLPITSDGHFLAYKAVNDDYTDCHTGTISNAVGEKPYMPRNMVDDNRNNHCSEGFHFCSKSYLNSMFRNKKIMIVKINPKDVVSIPADYNESKGRCNTYEVIGELGVSIDDAFTKPVQDTANEPEPIWVDDYYTPESMSDDRLDTDQDYEQY